MLANFIITSDDIFENGEIYENWTLGEQHIINKKQTIDIRGYYTFNSEELQNKNIAITGKKSNPTTTFYKSDSTNLITHLSENKLILSNNDGSFRAVGKFFNNEIIGRYQNKNGDYYNFNMNRDSSIFKRRKKCS